MSWVKIGLFVEMQSSVLWDGYEIGEKNDLFAVLLSCLLGYWRGPELFAPYCLCLSASLKRLLGFPMHYLNFITFFSVILKYKTLDFSWQKLSSFKMHLTFKSIGYSNQLSNHDHHDALTKIVKIICFCHGFHHYLHTWNFTNISNVSFSSTAFKAFKLICSLISCLCESNLNFSNACFYLALCSIQRET